MGQCSKRSRGGGITAVELDPQTAQIYSEFYPNDKVIIADAHEYLIKHFREFDFIWASPPCPTHSRLQFLQKEKKYPNMTLYEEIIFLKNFFKGKFVIENVKAYYNPLIEPSFQLNRHCFWSNREINSNKFQIDFNYTKIRDNILLMAKELDFNLDKYKLNNYKKRQLLRNCVHPQIGYFILKEILLNPKGNFV